MTKLINRFVFIFVLGLSFAAYPKSFWGGGTLSPSQIKLRWGSVPIDEAKFKSGALQERAAMAFTLVEQKKRYLGKSVTEIRSTFGNPTGFYFKDVFPAYLIQSGRNEKEESWQIVFELSSQRKVTDIFVHKNCCYQ